jgi:transketolase C-terminal domain/subunit
MSKKKSRITNTRKINQMVNDISLLRLILSCIVIDAGREIEVNIKSTMKKINDPWYMDIIIDEEKGKIVLSIKEEQFEKAKM